MYVMSDTKEMEPRSPFLTRNPYEDFMSTLPLETGRAPIFQLRKYQNFWIPQVHLPGVLAFQQHFQPRPDDILLLSYPKSGTTWLKALAFATLTRRQLDDHHPLLTLNPHDCVPLVEQSFSIEHSSNETMQAMPSPRLLHTHLPFSMLPESVRASECRLVYVCRDPKDVLVSGWHFDNRISAVAKEVSVPLSKAFEMFCQGVVSYGPVWEHVLESWKESLRRPEKVMFLRYEKMLEDPVGAVKSLAEFMGCPFSAAEEVGRTPEDIARLCCFENMSELEVNRTGKLLGTLPYDSFFRRGEKGDWRNHLTDKMAQRLDGVIRDHLKGRGEELFEGEASDLFHCLKS